ncbi:MAG: TonB-dependent receptor [Burkholderiales bacterium PBB3]|nr:MAG: TonB-dependent receptor [Burkholderiales bacterium PBB3]
MHPRHTPTLSLTLLALSLGLAFPAAAQTVTLTPVAITGQAASARKALADQERADHIVSVISADDIGALPDKNAAEALARMPGVSVQRDQGEGRYVSIRGLGPDLNSVTINGSLVPAPEASRRGVALDTLPAGMIRSLEVSKTLTPDRDANSIGGTVDVKTLSAFDVPGDLLTLGLGWSHDQLTGQVSPNANALWAGRLNGGTLGVAIGISKEQRKFGSDNVETGGAWTNGRLTGVELRDYLPNRERGAVSINLDYRPAKGETYYLRGFSSNFSDDEVRDRLTISNITGGSLAEGQSGTARAERRLRQRKYTQDMGSVVLGGTHQVANWELEAALGLGMANESTPESINDARFRQNGVTGVSFTNTQTPLLSGPTALYDPAGYSLNAITLQARTSKDKEQNIKFDAKHKFTLGSTPAELKLGAKLSRREKTNDTDQWSYAASAFGSPKMTPFVQGELDYSLGRVGLGINPALIRAALASLPRDAAKLARESAANDFVLNEDIDSTYVQSGFDLSEDWNVLVGVRNEATRFRANGFQINAANAIQALAKENSYSNLLPGIHSRYQLDKHTSLRAAWSNSVVRPNFSQIAPGVNLASATEATIGNPDLKPLKSSNLDLGVERMLGKDGAVSLYVFSKTIQDFTYTTNLAGTGAWANYTSAVSFANGDGAKVHGLELAYSQALRTLPGALSGLLVGANATYSKSSATLARYDIPTKSMQSRDVVMPGQSDTSVNLWLGYERGPLSARLALNKKSPYLLEVGGDILDARQDRYVDSQQQIDFTLGYQVHKNVQVTLDAINLTDEKYYVYLGTQAYNTQFERYGRTLRVGVKFAMF